MWGDSGFSERSAAQHRYLPYVGHATAHAVLLESGAVMAMAHVEGQPFELADYAARNARLRLLNTLYRNIADDNVTIYTHLVRYWDDAAGESGQFRSGFATALDAAYRKTVLQGKLFRNDYFVTLVVSPRSVLGTGFATRMARFRKKFPDVQEVLLRELEDLWLVLESGLETFGVRRLGLYEHDGVQFSEIGEALRLIITGRPLRVPVVSGHMGDSFYTDRVICGRRGSKSVHRTRAHSGRSFRSVNTPPKRNPGCSTRSCPPRFRWSCRNPLPSSRAPRRKTSSP